MSRLLIGDCREAMRTLIAEGVRVQMCVTSPPYWGLRDYGVAGQLGLEPTIGEYMTNMVVVFGLVRELLADDGVLFLNLGDTYWGGGRGGNPEESAFRKQASNHGSLIGARDSSQRNDCGLKPKDLCGIPWRLVFALHDAGWWLRQDIIWSKPNPMPESVRDRCTKSHEYLFLMAKSERYYFDSDAIAEPAQGWNGSELHDGKNLHVHPNVGKNRKGNGKTFRGGGAYTQGQSFDNSSDAERDSHGNEPNETGKRNKRSVWTVATHAYSGAHFATFPPKLIEPCILAGSRPGDIVFDPFFGSGTTGEVAQRLGREWIGCELNPKYDEMAKRRTSGTLGLQLHIA